MAKTSLLFFLVPAILIGQSVPLKSQEEISNTIIQTLEKCDSLFLHGDDIDLELEWLLAAENLATDLNSDADSLRIKIKKGIGFIYLDTDKNDNAIAYFKQILALAKKAKNREEKIQALMYVGQGHSKKLEFDDAIYYLEKALTLLNEKDSEVYPHSKTNALINIGLIYIDMGLTEEALNTLNKALAIAEKNKDFENKLVIYNNLSICYSDKKDYREAITYIKKSLVINEENDFGYDIEAYTNLGINYTDLQQFDSAQYYFNMGLKGALEIEESTATSSLYCSIGWMHCEQGKFKEGLPYLQRSLLIADSIQDTESSLEASQMLAEAYEMNGDAKSALQYYNQVSSFKEIIAKNNAQRKSEEFNIKYQALENDKTILALSKQDAYNENVIALEKKEKKLLWGVFLGLLVFTGLGTWVWYYMHNKSILEKERGLRFKSILAAEQKERKRIAQDLHDSVGQSISVVKMQANALQIASKIEEEKHEKLLNQVDLVYDALRDISHDIMPNTLITLGLVPAVKELITEIGVNDKLKIQLKNNADFKKLNDNQSITIYRIIQEILSNIATYAKASLVQIDLLNEDGRTAVYIKDNGIGMDTTKIKSMNDVGWKNIYSLVALLMGKIDITSKENQGTKIAIRFNA